MEHRQPNLDHVVVRVNHLDRSTDFVLNNFLNDAGMAAVTRVSSHYDYERIRNFLQANVGIPPTEPLIFSGAQRVRSKHDLELLIIGIQMGTTILPSLGELSMPGLVLQSESSAGDSENDNRPGAGGKIYDVTPQRPPQNPVWKDNTVHGKFDTADAPRSANPAIMGSPDSPTKRERPEHPKQPVAKRQKHPEVIELSDDESPGKANYEGDSSDDPERATSSNHGLLDDDADEEGSRQQVEDIGGQFANCSISAEDWKSVCRMFQCPEDSAEHRPAGFKLAISDYQLHAIWWKITQFPVRGVPGGCLGDEMGLGKTVEVLSTWIIFARIKVNYAEVLRYWKDGDAVDGRTHLPQHQQKETDLTCPSQHNSPYGVLCPCVQSGETYLVATALPSLPTICFAPPSSIHGWRREFEKLVDLNDPIMRHLKFSIMHNDFSGEAYYHGKDRVKMTTAKACRCYVDKRGQPNCYLSGQEGLSDWFLLVSSSGVLALLNAYNIKKVIYRSQKSDDDDQATSMYEGKTFTTNGLAAAFVFFDEAHVYKGSSSSPTQPFSLLRKITRKSWEPTIAFAVSGSIPGGGPGQLTNIVDHILYVKGEREKGTPMIGGITRAVELEKKKSDWNYLLHKNHIISNPRTKAEVETRRKSIGELMKSLAPSILMARHNADAFRGRPIGDDGRRIVVKPIKCNMIDGTGRDAFCKLTANVRAYVSQALDQRHNAWVTGGRDGPEPTQRSVELEFFGGSGGSTAMKLGKAGGRSWIQLLRANVYPAVALLYVRELVNEDEFGADNINRHGDEACALAVSGAGRSMLIDRLAESPFWPYRAQLREQSSKFQRLCEYVEDMVAYRDCRPNADDPGPADGTNIRHMVMFTDSPVSSFITFMLLSKKYPHIQVMLINGRTPTVATKKIPEYGRREILDNLMSDCTNDSPNKILVTTYRICGTALSLQRANYCVLMEPARDAKEECQAAARVNRRGQLMKVVAVRLYDDRNLSEVLKRARHRNQDDILSSQEQGIRWDNFVR